MTFSHFSASKKYLLAQAGGWLAYIGLAFLLNQLVGINVDLNLLGGLAIAFFTGIAISHAYRFIILYFRWLECSIWQVILRVLLSSVVLGILFDIVYTYSSFLLLSADINIDLRYNIQQIFGWVIIFQFWSVIYFAYHYFKNYKQEEIKNLKLEAVNTEVALRNLRSQLNPHFIFNALNSMRALVDENPKAAKKGITQLANVLRLSLQSDKRNLIPLEEELLLVDDYLAIEKTRFEERLIIKKNIAEASLKVPFPPFMLQTLTENAIKHGVAKFAKGSELIIDISFENNVLDVKIKNRGDVSKQKLNKQNRGGIGLENTVKRLELLFGKMAKFELYQEGEMVVSRVYIANYPLV